MLWAAYFGAGAVSGNILSGWMYQLMPMMQLAVDRYASIKGEDCDTFRFCNFVVEHEGGL